jgi:DNA-binding transcriptional regulator YhcF (GntR family)
MWNGVETELNPGQLITGRKKLSEQTGIAESKIQRALKTFEKCHMIEQQTTTKNRLITVLNWDLYQTCEQQTNNKRTTSEQQLNTIKKERKKEGKNNTITKPDNVTDQTWEDFTTHRKGMKAPITQTVLNTFSSQAQKAGMTLELALIESISRGWRGFKAEWVNKNNNQANTDESGRVAAQREIERTLKYIDG